jgi:hypothetical protein
MLFISYLLAEYQTIPKERRAGLCIGKKTKYNATNMPHIDKKHWKALMSLKDPNTGTHPLSFLWFGGHPTLYTSMLILPVVGGIFGAIVGYWQVSKNLNSLGEPTVVRLGPPGR